MTDSPDVIADDVVAGKIMVLAGEASGDAHAAEFIRHLKADHPYVAVSGMGSHKMQNAGVDLFYDSSKIAVVGLVEVLKHWGEIKRAMALVKEKLETIKPDLLVLVDYPEFNLKMARYARSLGIKVLFYISPQVWAWRPKRIHKIGASIDHMAVIFKFEAKYYERANIPVTFVGHPLADEVKTDQTSVQTRESLDISTTDPVIGLFPGSRVSELSRLLPTMLDTANLLASNNPTMEFILPVANGLDRETIERQCNDAKANITLTDQNIYDVIASCDCIVSCSGTVTLEIGLLKIPMCIVYKMSALSYKIMSRLIKIPHIGLANIVADKSVVRELLQDDATAANIASEVESMLNDKPYRENMIRDLDRVSENLGEGGGAANMAKLVISFVNKDNGTV